MTTPFQRYAPSLLSFAVLVIGALQSVTSINLVVILQLVALTIGSALTLIVPLVDKRWQGGLKTGLEIVTALIALVLPYAIEGHITREQIFIVVIGGIKAVAAEIGVQIRTDPKLDVPIASIETAAIGSSSDLTDMPFDAVSEELDTATIESADYIAPPAEAATRSTP